MRALAHVRHAFRVNDEPPRRRTDVVERIAGDQRQRRSRRSIQHPQLVWLDNRVANDAVSKRPALCGEADFITCLNAPKRPKKGVTMSGQGGVSFLPGQRRVREMPDRHFQGFSSSPSATTTERPMRGISRRPIGADASTGVSTPCAARTASGGSRERSSRSSDDTLLDLVDERRERRRSNPQQTCDSDDDEATLDPAHDPIGSIPAHETSTSQQRTACAIAVTRADPQRSPGRVGGDMRIRRNRPSRAGFDET